MKFSDPEKALIVHLRGRPIGERLAALEYASSADPGLRERIPALLIAAEEVLLAGPEEDLAGHAVQALSAALAAAPEDASGMHVGNYKLLQKIGEGGFGVVWMAEQQQPVRRRVALKILKAGMDTDEVISRFEAERQALALMEHTNIARVFEAGATATGRPFFAMELVRGVAITRFCDENRLSAAARLRLFVTVCLAVQHAHQKGVIHRDLKPSNILVTLHDGVPVPKIIDFGIAKATSGRLTEKTLFTQFHAFIGTPAYTSPEQMEMSGLDVDTRSDIYSLGVLLYELLTGQPPFDSESLVKSGLEAMRRTIREIDPPRPSHRLRTLSDSNRSSVADRRATEAAKLSLLLRGDLDWIAMRCLEKDRTRRYDSAASLAADIERHLSDDAVEARPPSHAYHARKFIRRHKAAVVATTAVAGSLIAGLIVSSSLFVRERSAHNRAGLAEKKESDLRHEAEIGRTDEVKRAARTALDLANRNLADGRVTDGLAYLVYAARKDPLNRTLAPRIASVLATHNFLLPTGTPLDCGSRVLAVRYAKDGRSVFVGTEDGIFRVVDATTGVAKRQFSVGGKVNLGGWEFARDDETVVGARFPNNTFGVFDLVSGQPKIPPLQLAPAVWQYPEALGLGHSIGLSPDGRWIYALAQREFWLWDAASGTLRLNPKFPETIGGSDFSPNGDCLAVTTGNTIEQWSLPQCVLRSPALAFRERPPTGVPASAHVGFSPDGHSLVVFDFEVGRVFDAGTGTLLRTLPKLPGYLTPSSLIFSSGARVFGTGVRSTGSWDLRTGEFTPALLPAGDNLLSVSFDAHGRRGAATSADGLLRIFDLGAPALVAEPAWPQDGDFCAALSPDGTQVIVGTESGIVFRFAVGHGRARPLVLARSLQPAMPAPFLRTTPSRLLMLAGDRAKVVDVSSAREVAGGFVYPEPVLAPNSQESKPPIRSDLKFMVVRTRSGEWQSWELDADGVRKVVNLQEAPDKGGWLAFSATKDLVSITNGAVRVWNLRTGTPVGPPFTHPASIVYLTPNFSHDAAQLALGTADGAALILDIATGRVIRRFETRPLAPNQRVLFSPDGERLLTANIRNETRLWDAATGKEIASVAPLLGSPGQAIFSDDGRWLATWSESYVRLAEARTGNSVGKMVPAGGKHVRFSRDGNRLATGDRMPNAQVWDVPSGEAVTEPMGYMLRATVLPEFSPDGRFLRTESDVFSIWSIPPAPAEGTSPPAWLLELATLCASKIVDEQGQLIRAHTEFSQAETLRRRIAALPVDEPYADWGRWILNERADRSIGPGFTITPAEAQALAATPVDSISNPP